MKSTEDWGRKNLIVQKYLKDGKMVGLMGLVTEMKLVSSIISLEFTGFSKHLAFCNTLVKFVKNSLFKEPIFKNARVSKNLYQP